MLAHEFLMDPPPPPAPVIVSEEMATSLHYLFVVLHGGQPARTLSYTTYSGHRATLRKAETIGAVKLIESTRFSSKPKKFWMLTDIGKHAIAKIRR